MGAASIQAFGYPFTRRAVSHPGGTPCLWARRSGSAMFVCQLCGKTVPPRTPAARVVTRRRPKQYPFRPDANVFWRPDDQGKKKERKTNDPGGVGWEIACQVLACPACAATQPPDG